MKIDAKLQQLTIAPLLTLGLIVASICLESVHQNCVLRMHGIIKLKTKSHLIDRLGHLLIQQAGVQQIQQKQ